MKIMIFEGLPGSGKTTLIRRISKKFNQPRVFELIDKEGVELRPKDSEGRDVDYFLKNDLNKYVQAEKLSKKSRFVLVDRGVFSTFAYNSCVGDKKILQKARKNLDKINKKFDRKVFYIYIKISPKISLSRKKRRENKSNLWSFEKNLRKIEEIYDQIFKGRTNVITIDGRKKFGAIRKEIEAFLSILTS